MPPKHRKAWHCFTLCPKVLNFCVLYQKWIHIEKYNLDHTDEVRKLSTLWTNFVRNIKIYFSLHQGDMVILTLDIDTVDDPPIAHKPYTLQIKHAQRIHEEAEMLEKDGIIFRSVSL